jgi:predicted nucleic acid-binding protein
MTTHFVDTSGLLAILSASDRFHSVASAAWVGWVTNEIPLVTSNYILTETTAVAQRRLGFDAVTVLYADIVPVLHVEWVDPALHQAAAAMLMTIRQRPLSLVDCTSFEIMRRLGLRRAFTFDRHFAEQGFACLP